ncbi:MAG: amino acid transporter substrate-binding protein [Actinomycetia bacterium]|nr:amino acid transporter substrate-binding protein [Actinomycetes bacterium]
MTTLRLACINSAAAPLFELGGADGRRLGYEPAVGALLAETLGWDLAWVYLPWAQLLPSLDDGRADAVLCGQSIIPTRQAVADFTAPYAVFHESVLVRAGDPVTSAEGLRGKRVAAIAASTNMALAETFDEAVTVAFGGESDDVFGDMLAALRAGDVDAVVDDDVVFVSLAGAAEFDLGFTVKTGNRWGLAVSKSRPSLLDALDEALAAVKADGRLAAAWAQWLPSLEYPFTAE